MDRKNETKLNETAPPPDLGHLERLAAFLRLIPQDGALDRLLRGETRQEPPQSALASDILHGAAEIAQFIYGDAKHRRKVYRLVEAGYLPCFRIGIRLCSRRSELLRWIEAEEREMRNRAADEPRNGG